MIRKYLVQIEDRPNTHWLIPHDRINGHVTIRLRCIADSLTEGDHPKVTVIEEEAPATQPGGESN